MEGGKYIGKHSFIYFSLRYERRVETIYVKFFPPQRNLESKYFGLKRFFGLQRTGPKIVRPTKFWSRNVFSPQIYCVQKILEQIK